MLILTDHSEHAKKQFHQALSEKYTVKLLVFGSSNLTSAIAKKAEVAERKNPVRKVIWLQNGQILSEGEKNLYRRGKNDINVVVLNLAGNPVHFLTEQEANSMTAIERAFLLAQQN